ncbi:MFS transporter [Streptomyces sp. B5E4]|uniref:MFS transporter n=1 Tax=Streptomyces sp. B5E4 TaxID=3153568 RepID=UPI00325C4199
MLRKWRGNPWAILTTLSLGFFMTLIDLTIVNIAIPDMVEDLDASLDEVLWVVNAYTLALAVLMITAGRLGDLRGKRNLFAAGVAFFTLASLACGLAQDPAQLIAFRAVQGVGAAMLMPQTLSIIADVFPADKRGVAMGIWGAVAGVSGALGPILGGALISELDWRWIFLVNLPLGALVLFLAVALIPDTRRAERHRLGLPGVALASAALLCLAFALIEGERYDWNGWIVALLGASAALLVAFLAYERGRQDDEPLVPFSLFKDRNFALVNFVGIAVSFGIVGMLLPLTIYLQSVLGFSPLKAGLVLLPMALGSIVTAGPAGAFADRIGGKYILMTGLLAWGAGLFWVVSAAEPGASWTTVAPGLGLIGLGAGCTFAPMATEVMRNVPAGLTGAASGLNNSLRQVGSVLAGAVIGAVLQTQIAASLTDEARRQATALPEDYRDDFVAGFADSGSAGGDVGATQNAAADLPADIPDAVATRMQELGGQVFGQGFVDAMGPTIGVSVAVLAAGAVACLAVKRHVGPSPAGHGLPAADDIPGAEAATDTGAATGSGPVAAADHA